MDEKYFENNQRKVRYASVIIDQFIKKAEFYKWLYELTGLEWAKNKNRYYYTEGMKLAIGCLGVCYMDIGILETIIKGE